VIKTSALDDGQAAGRGFLGKTPEILFRVRSGGEGEVVSAGQGLGGLIARKAGQLEDFLGGEIGQGTKRGSLPLLKIFEKGPDLGEPHPQGNSHIRLGFRETFLLGFREIAPRDEGRPAVFDGERLLDSEAFDEFERFFLRLAGHEDERDVVALQELDPRPGGFEVVGLVVEKGVVQVAKKSKIHGVSASVAFLGPASFCEIRGSIPIIGERGFFVNTTAPPSSLRSHGPFIPR
jgi:hypothetical protein